MKIFFAVVMAISLMVVQTKADNDDDYSAEGDENYQDNTELDLSPPFDGTTTTVAPDDYDEYAYFGSVSVGLSQAPSCRGILQFGYDNNRIKKMWVCMLLIE